MKARNGFVSNSSSSSFILFKDYLTPEQMDHIRNRADYGLSQEYFEKAKAWYIKKYPDRELPEFLRRDKPEVKEDDYEWDVTDDWNVEETSHTFDFSTDMDNFDMEQFLNIIGIDVEKCGMWLEYTGTYRHTLGLNDAKTDLKNYSTDDYYMDDYDEKYLYTSRRYREEDYPEFLDIYKKYEYGNPPHEPITPKKWICEDAGRALREVKHKVEELAVENGCYFLEKMKNDQYYDDKCRIYAEVIDVIKEVEDNWQAVDEYEEDAMREDDSQRVMAAIEGQGYFNREDEEAYRESVDKLYDRPLGVNVNDLYGKD